MRYFGKDASEFAATDGAGHALRVRRIDLSRVVIDGHHEGDRVQVRYRVNARLLSDDGAELSYEHAYLNPGAILPMVRALSSRACDLTLTAVPSGWHVFGGDGEHLHGASYLQLIDQPLEVAPESAIVRGERVILGVRFSVVIHSADHEHARAVMPLLLRNLASIVEAEHRLAGALPFSRYWLLFHLDARLDHLVALEHAAATSVVAPPTLLDNASWFELQHVMAHEIFHAWNSRRLVPMASQDFDLEVAQAIPSLWISEGLTEHVALVSLRRAGLISVEKLASELGEAFSRTHFAERASLSLEDLARLAFSSPSVLAADPDAYYAAGHAVSLAVVAEMLQHSAGKVGLEQLLAALLPAANAAPRVIDTATLGRVIDALVPATPPISATLRRWVEAPLSLAQLLPSMDRLGLHATVSAELEPDFGFGTSDDSTQIELVVPGEAYARAGGFVGDRLLRVDGKAFRGAQSVPDPLPSELPLEIDRAGKTRTLVLRPRMVASDRVQVDAHALQTGDARLERLIGAAPTQPH
jgi:predicted metalloprotease with PDZ domain